MSRLGELADIEVVRITSIMQVGKSDDGAILISRSRDVDAPNDLWIEFETAEIAVDFLRNAVNAVRDYIARPDVVL